MIFDPATHTFDINYGHEPSGEPESPLQRELEALWTTLLVVLLAPFWLAYKGCEKYHKWQDDRTYDFQKEVLKQPPVAVMVCKVGYGDSHDAYTLIGNISTEELAKLRIVSRQPSQEDGEKVDLLVLAPSKAEKNVQWITCNILAGQDSIENDDNGVSNIGNLTTVCCLFEGRPECLGAGRTSLGRLWLFRREVH